MRRTFLSAAALSVSLLSLGCGHGGQGDRLTGGGSSFINPMMTKWAGMYRDQKHVQIDYTSSGSGNGIQQMRDKKNDFGCTDAPMTDEQLTKAKEIGGEVIHVPLVMGGVVPIYNLSKESVNKPLRFTGPVLADIYLGKIKKWNEKPLKDLNPGVMLPDQEIAVVHRSDGSGTTYIFSDYLCQVSPEWKEKVGKNTELKWPVGIGAQKNDGVAGQVSRSDGAIGYVELNYAMNSKLQYGSVKNKEGKFILASLESVTKAAEAKKDFPEDLRFSLVDPPGEEAYPICGTTWAVLYVKQSPEKAKALREFLHWCTHEGQDATAELLYARLSPGLVRLVDQKLELLK
jgi:phosphate transport system substrate-binding protein